MALFIENCECWLWERLYPQADDDTFLCLNAANVEKRPICPENAVVGRNEDGSFLVCTVFECVLNEQNSKVPSIERIKISRELQIEIARQHLAGKEDDKLKE